jgi:hypothetical protein
MSYGTLADATLVLHLVFIAFIVLGGLVVARWPRVAWLHLPAAAWGVLIELGGWVCPLTPLENWLRLQAGQQGYSGSFVERYLLPVIYPEALTRDVQFVLAAVVLVVNVAVYAFVLRRLRR